MTYHNAVKYLQQLPLESTDSSALPLLWEALDSPQRNLKYLRFTGSNGKTVCAELLLSAFERSEHTVGSLSLPVQNDGKRNIRINALPLPPEEFASYVERIVHALKAICAESSEDANASLSQSELLLSVALLAFREHRCSFCVIESDASATDPTRRLPAPFAAAICGTIPAEHQKELQQIRSYIVHGIQEIVSAPQNQNAYRLISETCAAVNCRLTIPTKTELKIERLSLSGNEFSYKNEKYKLALCGKFQVTNATVVLELISMLARHGFPLEQAQIAEGLRQTKLPAKFEIISVSPTIVVDSTHSETAVEVVCESLADFQPILGDKLHLCLPSGALEEQYLHALTLHDFAIDSITIYEKETNLKEMIASLLPKLSKADVLLVSGHCDQTLHIRDEILKKLHK